VLSFPFIATSRRGHQDNFVWNSFRLMAFRFMRQTDGYNQDKGFPNAEGLGSGRISMMSRIQMVDWRTFPCMCVVHVVHVAGCWNGEWHGKDGATSNAACSFLFGTQWTSITIDRLWDTYAYYFGIAMLSTCVSFVFK